MITNPELEDLVLATLEGLVQPVGCGCCFRLTGEGLPAGRVGSWLALLLLREQQPKRLVRQTKAACGEFQWVTATEEDATGIIRPFQPMMRIARFTLPDEDM